MYLYINVFTDWLSCYAWVMRRFLVVSVKCIIHNYTIHMYSGITSGRVLDGELLHTKILEVNLFAFAYRLFHRDFSPIKMTFCKKKAKKGKMSR